MREKRAANRMPTPQLCIGSVLLIRWANGISFFVFCLVTNRYFRETEGEDVAYALFFLLVNGMAWGECNNRYKRALRFAGSEWPCSLWSEIENEEDFHHRGHILIRFASFTFCRE